MTAIGILSGLVLASPPAPSTGLNWPLDNGDALSDVRFQLESTNVVHRYPRTEIRRYTPRVQTSGFFCVDFRTSFTEPSSFVGDGSYEGFHPYPYGGTYHWEISVAGSDTPNFMSGLDDNGNSTAVTWDREYIQGIRLNMVSGDIVIEFFYDLPSLTKKITYTMASADIDGDAAGVVHVFGASPWTGSWDVNTETLSGKLRGLQIFDTKLSDANMLSAAACNTDAAVLALSLSPWYLNMNPTPTDISDKSGSGHNPVWVGSNRPILWTP